MVSDVLDSVQVENLYIGRNWSYRENYPLSTEVKSVIIGDLVTSLPDYAFYLCDALSSVKIPDSVNSIGIKAFWDAVA